MLGNMNHRNIMHNPLFSVFLSHKHHERQFLWTSAEDTGHIRTPRSLQVLLLQMKTKEATGSTSKVVTALCKIRLERSTLLTLTASASDFCCFHGSPGIISQARQLRWIKSSGGSRLYASVPGLGQLEGLNDAQWLPAVDSQ